MSAKLSQIWDRALTNRWSRIVLALVAGLAAALAHPPFGFLPGLLGYPLLMLLAERSVRARGGFWMGWLAGFAYFFIGCWWVAEAFLVNKDQAWMAPFAASLLPMGLGLFFGAACALYRAFAPKSVLRVILFAVMFSLLEWTRGHVLTGFPWNPAGATWKAGSALSQMASIFGVYGLGLITVAAVSSLGLLVAEGPRRARFGGVVCGLLVLAIGYGYGAQRLSQAQRSDTSTLIRIVQADIPQASKWTPKAYQSILDKYVALTAQPAAQATGKRPDVVVWPEGALPTTANAVFASDDIVAIAKALETGQTLMIGISRAEPSPMAEGGYAYFNSLLALRDIGPQGLMVEGAYDKHHLVPFGEYLPLGSLMTRFGIRSLVHVPADFTVGPVPAPLTLPGLPAVQPLICYEALFPGYTPARGAARPGWIVNVSNDAWFGKSSGPLQHLNLASYRAIETGLPIVRATPTGSSAMIDPWGRVLDNQRLDSGQAGIIDAYLPNRTGQTLFGRWGDAAFWVLMVLLSGLAISGRYFRF
jgi:apolipoprotein N-acyltransferase